MTPTLSVLLCLGLCLGQRMKTQADRPSLSADKSPLVPKGSSVTLRCPGLWGADHCLLLKEQEPGTVKVIAEKPVGREVEFLIPRVTAKDAGKYYCSYRSSSDWFPYSATLKLVVTGLHDPPSLSAWPSSQMISGQQATLQCHSKSRYGGFALYKDGTELERKWAQAQWWGAQATFSLLAATPAHGGTYRCYSFHNYKPYEWSAPSEPLVLWVTDPSTTKDLHLTQSPENPPSLTSSPRKISPTSTSGHSWFGILIGISVFLILLILFLLLLLWHRRWQRQTRLRNGDREAETKKTSRSSDPYEIPLEETLYADVGEDRHTEEARPENTAVAAGDDPQEVTYAQLNLNSLKVGVEDPPTSGSENPSVYAALR